MSFLGGQNSQQKANDAQIAANNKQLFDIAGNASGRADKSFKFFKQYGTDAGDFWKTLLGGDRNAITSVLQPEISNINNTYNNRANELTAFTPRGGARASGYTDLEAAKARDIGNLFNAVRPMAANSLSSLASLFGNMSNAQTGNALGAYNDVNNSLFGLNREQADVQNRRAQFFGQLGQGLGSLAGGYLFNRGS